MGGFLNVITPNDEITYMPLNGFTTVDIGCERGNNSYNMMTRFEAPSSGEFVRLFDDVWRDKGKLQDVTEQVIDNIIVAYKENAADFLYFFTLYNIFNEFLEDISEDVLPNEATGFKQSKIWNLLYAFQKDAALAIINKLEQYNGCILADSVGLGKTFTALAVIKYYENRNRSVLVLCPKKLGDNWRTFRENYKNNPIAADRLRYDVLYHTDLSRTRGMSGSIDLEKIVWENYDLAVIDESHNFRNGGEVYGCEERDNRYNVLMKKVIRAGVKTKVLMLSATPVNNRFTDLRNQLALAYEGTPGLINEKLNTTKPIDKIFRNAQTVFNQWSKQEPEQRTTAALLKSLDFDFFEVLDSVTIARSRKHVEKYYDIEEIGKFPERLKPITLRPDLTDLDKAVTYNNLESRVETRMRISVMTSTGGDDLINAEEKGELEYRKAQLERLQNEVVDIEEMQSGISIMDLGLNEFRLDLLDYAKTHGELDKTPFGLHAVVPASNEYPPGGAGALKNINGGVNINNINRLHPCAREQWEKKARSEKQPRRKWELAEEAKKLKNTTEVHDG
jgi:hypothetical protein